MLNHSPMLAFVVTVLLIPLLGKLARPLGLVDFPGGRKHHRAAVPVVGGVAMFAALFVASLLVGEDFPSAPPGLAWAVCLLVMTGVMDDAYELTPRSRFVAQIAAAVLMASGGGIYVTSLGSISGEAPVELANWSIPFTVFAVVGVINALNMMDGLDGLAGGVAFTAFAWFALVAWLLGDAPALAWLGMLLASLLGFLCYNMHYPGRRKAAVFMGDAGSMMLGFLLAVFSVFLTQDRHSSLAPVGALWVLALPIMDTVSVMLRRIFQGHSPFVADSGHLHHLLQGAGHGPGATLAIMLALSLLSGAAGVAGWYWDVPERWMFRAFLLAFLVYFIVVTRLGRVNSPDGR